MMKHILSLALLVVLQVSLISSRSDYYNYYTDDHDKKVSTPEIELSPGDENNTEVPENITVIQKGLVYDDLRSDKAYQMDMLFIAIGVPVGVISAVMIFVGVICGIKFFCPGCCGKVRPGFVMQNTAQITIPQSQQAIVAQNVLPRGTLAQVPPPYSEQDTQSQQHMQTTPQQYQRFS